MNHYQNRHRHDIGEEFLQKFLHVFDGAELECLVEHLDSFPSDGETVLAQVTGFRVLRWGSASRQRDIFYLYRKDSGIIVYVDCVDPLGPGRRWFRDIDPVQSIKLGVRIMELIEKISSLLFMHLPYRPSRSRVGGSRDYQEERR